MAAMERTPPGEITTTETMMSKTTSNVAVEIESEQESSSSSLLKQLGSPAYVMAPMVGQSEYAFRMFCKRYGTQLTYTPMIWSERFVAEPEYRKKAFQTSREDRPLIVQFCGNDPKILLEAALLIQDECDAIDINLGCPQDLAKENNFGAYLCKDWKLVEEIVSTLSKNLRVPVACKIRKLTSGFEKTVQFAKMLEAAGCQLLGVHARTKEQNRYGPADWDLIKTIKQTVKIPVIANGNIHRFEDVSACLSYTGADAVMSAEALLANPALYSGQVIPCCVLAREYVSFANQVEHVPSIKCIRQHVINILVEFLAPHRRSYLKTAKKETPHVDLWQRLKEAGDVEEIEKVITELERRQSTGEKFSRQTVRSRIIEQVEEEVLLDCGSIFDE
eukprot:TRINITY_DN16379_c0_g1_i1.p1 TRINITY_DN16379_c0_g1~~TRINITY_DN16379_c0_g1_i1.p1  ORF type:complete len:405 (+),score=71.58 TRINITY_DN16379_c0_g1_i1:47-1216(+)